MKYCLLIYVIIFYLSLLPKLKKLPTGCKGDVIHRMVEELFFEGKFSFDDCPGPLSEKNFTGEADCNYSFN